MDSGESAKGEVNQSAVKKMVGRQPGDGPMVGDDDRNALDAVQTEQIHRGHAQSGNLPRKLRAGDACDDSVAAPVPQPLRRGIVEPPLVVMDRPRPVLSHVGRDPCNKPRP